MTKRKAIEDAFNQLRQLLPNNGNSRDEQLLKRWLLLHGPLACLYETGRIAGLRKAAKDIKGSSGSVAWNAVMLSTKARELAKKVRAK